MRHRLVAAALLLCLSGRPQSAAADAANFASPGIDARAGALLARMTLEEKVGQLNQVSASLATGPAHDSRGIDELVRRGLVGSILNAKSGPETNAFQREALENSRLRVPILFGLDVIHGFMTIFPIPLGLSASWDTGLIEQTARCAAREAAGQGIRWTFSPMVDIARDPRWGRIAEGAGEDPYLGSAIARAYVRGYQGRSLGDPNSIVACAKHFVGYGAAEGGRDYNTTEISERTLREIYLPPFRAAVREGAGSLMSAFNALNGVPASANALTLGRILRDEWAFRGFVVTDWTAVREVGVHGIADDLPTAARKCFLAGADMDMVSLSYLSELPALVRSGAVPSERLDDAVRRVLRVKLALGLFERPFAAEPGAKAQVTEEDRGLARRAAEESFVMLENRAVRGGAPLLPLKGAPGRRIALIGPLADGAKDMLGSWSCQGRPEDVATLRSALEARAARDGIALSYCGGSGIYGGGEEIAQAVAAARQADVAIVALGERGVDSGEAASRSHLDLPGNQEQLLEAVAGTGTPVVLIVFSGRPLAISWAAEHVPSIILAWFPGLEAGPALVRALFGEAEPGGRLTVSIPRSVGQVPIHYNSFNTGRPRRDPIGMELSNSEPPYVSGYIDEADSPLYPFGYGLAYTSFEYSPVRVNAAAVSARSLEEGKARLGIGVDVRNTGPRDGTEIVQLYIRLRGTSVARPVRELKGFERVHLAPGETRRVEFALGRDELAFWNIDMKFQVEPGSLYVWAAPDSAHGSPARVEIQP